jgi:TPR repeat protein
MKTTSATLPLILLATLCGLDASCLAQTTPPPDPDVSQQAPRRIPITDTTATEDFFFNARIQQSTERKVYGRGLAEKWAEVVADGFASGTSAASNIVAAIRAKPNFYALVNAVIEDSANLPDTGEPLDRQATQLLLSTLNEEFVSRTTKCGSSLFFRDVNQGADIIQFEKPLALTISKRDLTKTERERGLRWSGSITAAEERGFRRSFSKGEWSKDGDEVRIQVQILASKKIGQPWSVSTIPEYAWLPVSCEKIQDWLALDTFQKAANADAFIEAPDAASGRAARAAFTEALSALDSLTQGEAIIKLARWYWRGTNGLPVDREKALTLFEKAARRGDPVGLYNYGIALNAGIASSTNASEGANMVEAAAKAGYPPAQYLQGVILFGQIGTPNKNVAEESNSYLSRAALNGYSKARTNPQPGICFEDQMPNGRWYQRPDPRPVDNSTSQDNNGESLVDTMERLTKTPEFLVAAIAGLGPPLIKRKASQEYAKVVDDFLTAAQKQTLMQQSELFAGLLKNLQRGSLSDDLWKEIQPRVEEFAKAGIPEAMAALVFKNVVYGDLSESDVFRPLLEVHDLELTTKCLKALAEQGDGDATFHLGRLTMDGKGNAGSPIQSFATARNLLRTALTHSNSATLLVLCVLDYTESLSPLGSESRRRELAASARESAKQAAAKGDPIGIALFGRMLIEGVGGFVNTELGEQQLRLATKAGRKVEMPAYSTAAAVTGNGSVTGTSTSWHLDIQLGIAGTLSCCQLIDGKTGRLKGRTLSGRSYPAQHRITGSVQELVGVTVESGDRFELIGGGGGICLFAVVIPPSKAPPQYRLPELDRYFQRYFPGGRIEPGPVARPGSGLTSVQWTSDLAAGKRQASAQRKSVLLLMTDQSTESFEKKTFGTPEFAEYADANLVPVKVTVNSWNGPEVPARELQRQYAVAKFPAVILLNSNGTELGRCGAAQEGSKAMIAALESFKANPTPQVTQPPPPAQQPVNTPRQRVPRRSSGGFK